MSRKGHRVGGKVTKGHSTLIPVSEVVVDSLENDDNVTKISLGPIKSFSGTRRSAKNSG